MLRQPVAVLVLDGAIFFNFMTPNLYPDLIERIAGTVLGWTG